MRLDWSSSRYAGGIAGTSHFDTHFLWVLTGRDPFAGINVLALAYHVPLGGRPAKLEDAYAIGFSDSLWGFTEHCWSGEIESRPKVGEVVTHLGKAAVEWGEPMPPSVPTRSVASCSDDEEWGEFGI